MSDAKTLIEFIKANAGTAPTVETQAQADEFTAADPLGHKWRVGESYYAIEAHPDSFLSRLHRGEVTQASGLPTAEFAKVLTKGLGEMSPAERFKHFASKG